MFGFICAQRDLELEIGFGSARVHSLRCARKSVRARARQTAGDRVTGPCISSLELALAARSGTIDVHGDDKLAEESEEKWCGCGGVGGGGI